MERGSLLARLDEELGGGPRTWGEFVMVRNNGPLLSPRFLPGDRISNRGFNAVLSDRDGSPSHYLKARPVTHRRSQREAEVHTRLGSHSIGRRLAPLAKSFVFGPVRVLAIEFMEGDRFDALLKAHGRGVGWGGLVGSLLDGARDFWIALDQVLGTRQKPNESLTLAASDETFAILRDIGLDGRVASALEKRTRDLTLPSVPQHGDFWPRNLLRVADSWRILDFETCGDVDLPLYDLFHLIRGAAGSAAGGEPGGWLRRWAENGSQPGLLQNAVRMQARGLTPEQVEAALACYLADFSVRLFKRGISRGRTAPWIREMELLPKVFDEGLVPRAVLGNPPEVGSAR